MSDREDSDRSRRRGVIASRPRLEQAMARAGFRTQAALAERIAEMEGIDTPPTHLVSRIFRGHPVEPRSLERLARALGVEGHTLYLSGEESHPLAVAGERERPSEDEGGATAAPPPPGSGSRGPFHRRPWFAPTALLTLVLGISIVFGLRPPPEVPVAPLPTPAERPLPAGRTLALLPLRSEKGGPVPEELLRLVHRVLEGSEPGLISLPATRDLPPGDPEEARRRLAVDGLVSGRLLQKGRYRALMLFYHDDRGRRLLWSGAWPGRSTAFLEQRLSAELPARLAAVRSGAGGGGEAYPGEDALAHFLAGRRHQSRPPEELQVKRAITRFEAAIRAAPRFAQAHAAICLSFSDLFLQNGDSQFLEAARRACEEAMGLDDSLPLVPGAMGVVEWVAGRLEEAESLLERALEIDPRDGDLLRWKAEVLIARYLADGDPLLRAQALETIERAVASEPGYWKLWMVKGRVHYYGGEIEAAREATRRGAELDRNPILLTNLGSIEFCLGNHGAARDLYLEVQEMAPGYYVGDSFMGSIHFMLGDYRQAVESWEKAGESQQEDSDPDLHAARARLAEAWLMLGDRERARELMREAIRIAERRLAEDGDATETAAYLASYYTHMRTIDAAGWNDGEVEATIRKMIGRGERSPGQHAQIRLAHALAGLGEMEEAESHFRKATEVCPGFAAAAPFYTALRQRWLARHGGSG